MQRPRQFRWGLAVCGGVLALLIAWVIFGSHKTTKPTKTPVVSVTVAKAEVQDIPLSITELGSALPWQGVTVHAQVSGVLKRVGFAEGSFVQQGAVLAEIDSAPYRAALLQAQGALKRDRALLEEARLDLKRYQTLAAEDSIAKQQVDAQNALVKQDEGTVLLDKGGVDAAQVNVNYCRILSPVAGRVGVRLVDPGNVVSATDTTGIVIVNQITPIAVTFAVPEGDFQRLMDVSKGFTQPLDTRALSQESGDDLGFGTLSIADNHVDQSSGTVQMKARFPNSAMRLWPSQFVNVKLTLETLHGATTVPAAAVNQGPNGAFAYVIGADKTAKVRPLTVQATQDAVAVIKTGLNPGETVVVDGQFLLKPGATVSIRQASPGKKPSA